MGRSTRVYSNTGIYHIIFRGVNQQTIFEEQRDFEKLKKTIATVKEEMRFQIYAYCFMSNHVHLVIKEKEQRDISLIMKRILTKYAGWYNFKYARSGSLFESRYKSVPVENDEYFLHLIRYVHRNPVNGGIAEIAEQYPYSSYREYISQADLADTDFVFELIDKKAFIEFHQQNDELEFEINGSKSKTDDDVRRVIQKRYKIDNAKNIAQMPKEKRNKILEELKNEFSARQLQRVTGICREVIGKA